MFNENEKKLLISLLDTPVSLKPSQFNEYLSFINGILAKINPSEENKEEAKEAT